MKKCWNRKWTLNCQGKLEKILLIWTQDYSKLSIWKGRYFTQWKIWQSDNLKNWCKISLKWWDRIDNWLFKRQEKLIINTETENMRRITSRNFPGWQIQCKAVNQVLRMWLHFPRLDNSINFTLQHQCGYFFKSWTLKVLPNICMAGLRKSKKIPSWDIQY